MLGIQDRITSLRETADKQDGFVKREVWYQFRVSPSCPPSRQLHLRGGQLCSTYIYEVPAEYEYRTWTVPDLTIDLADLASVTIDVAFENAGYYQFFLLELRMPLVAEQPTISDWMFYLHGTWDEFTTAGEAESWLQSEAFQLSKPWVHSIEGVWFVAYPLCGLVLKNNGTPGAGCPILPVDYVNRGRSYLWPPDMRPITSIYD